MFIALNLIKDDFAIINSYPIIYENNTEDIPIIDQIKGNFLFKNYINSTIHFSSFDKISLKICYIVNNDSQYYYEQSYQISDIFDIFDIYKWEDFVIDDLRYLYKCAFKKDTELSDLQQIYSLLKKRYPNKININVVINYILSKLKDYKVLNTENLNIIKNNFISNIKDE